jgi:hypothetical protein
VLQLGGVDRQTFLTLLRRSDVYLRSAKTEGASTSIREAVYLGVPVVANENPDHPAGVVSYPWGCESAMTDALCNVLEGTQGKLGATDDLPSVPDTVAEEAALLVACWLGKRPAIPAERGRS